MEKWDGSLLYINTTVTKLGEKCKGILGMHAFSGCGTVSYPSEKGKVSALHVLNQTDIAGLDSVLGEKDATHSELIATGKTFFLSLYGQQKITSTNAARYEIYSKRKNPPSLKTLPPTDLNLALHSQRANLQMMLWKAADKTDPPDVKINDHAWEITLNDDVVSLPLHQNLYWTSLAVRARYRGMYVTGSVVVQHTDYRVPITVHAKQRMSVVTR